MIPTINFPNLEGDLEFVKWEEYLLKPWYIALNLSYVECLCDLKISGLAKVRSCLLLDHIHNFDLRNIQED